jgi:hypothetical protein
MKRTVSRSLASTETITIPPLLLEGDEPGPLPVTGPGEKYVLGPQAPVEPAEPGALELPEAYGTGRLLLVARDPHWLYTHWDFTRQQQQAYNALSADRHLVVRLHTEPLTAEPKEIHVHPESRHWFIEVERAGAKYVAELGYYDRARQWTSIATSKQTATPPDRRSPDKSAEFVCVEEIAGAEESSTLPGREPERDPTETHHPPVAAAPTLITPPHIGWIPALESTPQRTRREVGASTWSESKEQALAEIVSWESVPRVCSSAELAASIRRAEESSPFGGELPQAAGFWFNVNAELIVYGATEPNANVTIGGQSIELRPDGSFSIRVALPEGSFELPVTAHSIHGEIRQAEFQFSRRTEYKGEVGVQPPDDQAKPPCE